MAGKQLLHLVLGGELVSTRSVEFKNLNEVEIVGLYPSYADAYKAWRGKAAATMDSANVRYFVVHIHRLLDPSTDTTHDHEH